MLRVGILTSGGDCQALNATMRGVAKALYKNVKDVEIYGILDGYKGLINGNYKLMKPKDFSGILTVGGTIIGTSRQPFKMMEVIEEDGVDKIKAMKETYKKLKLDVLCVLGGNGSLKSANLLSEKGLNVVACPKTNENDIYGTDMTFGYHSAVEIATRAIDAIHTTAASHSRIFIVEIMGHKVGWITMNAGIAGGADVILLPEIPYDINIIAKAIKDREKEGKKFTIIACAEGAISKEEAALSKKEYKQRIATREYPSVAYEIADKLGEMTGAEVRVTVPGHTQRGGSPCAYDRVISTQFGARAAELILNNDYGKMVALIGNEITAIPLSATAGKLKYVDPQSSEIRHAELTGISFGDK